MTEILIQLAYLFAAFLFITALRALGRPDSARRGMQLAAFGMAVAIIATLFHAGVVSYEWIVVGAAVGAVAGYPLGMWVPMTAMPQRIALSHAFGALAATLVGIGEYIIGFSGGTLVRSTVAALGLEVLFGGVTVTGSLMAFGKLQGILPGRPLTFRGQNAINALLFAACCGCVVWLIAFPTQVAVFSAMATLAVLLGVLFVLYFDHRRCAGRSERLDPLDRHEQGDEPIFRECAIRGVRCAYHRCARRNGRRGRNVRHDRRGRRVAARLR